MRDVRGGFINLRMWDASLVVSLAIRMLIPVDEHLLLLCFRPYPYLINSYSRDCSWGVKSTPDRVFFITKCLFLNRSLRACHYNNSGTPQSWNETVTMRIVIFSHVCSLSQVYANITAITRQFGEESSILLSEYLNSRL